MSNEDSLFQQLVDQDDITWQVMIQELVKNEQMDPWDVDISVISEKFLTFIEQMKETNLRISGKIILAAALLLRLKSGRFIDTDLVNLENLMNDDYDEFEEWVDENGIKHQKADPANFPIFPRTPQPRKRRVSVVDLMDALGKVIDTNHRKSMNKKKDVAPSVIIRKNVDINEVIDEVEKRLNKHSKKMKTKTMKFSDIIPSDRKEDKILTFIPLLHLTNARKTDLFQEEHFGDFDIHML